MIRKILLLFVLGGLAVSSDLAAQEPSWDTMFVEKGPLRGGMIFLPGPGMNVIEGSDNIVEIRSRKGSIYNMKAGTVVKIFAVEGTLTAILKTPEQEFYVYSNLATVCPSTGDELASGEHLGECLTDSQGWFVLELAKSDREKFLNRAELRKMLWLLD